MGECARKLALARTKAWKLKKTFSVRQGIVPGVHTQELEEAM